MTEPIYFTRIMFTEGLSQRYPRSIILLDLPNRELCYQVYSWKKNMPAIQGERKDEWWEKITGKERIESFSSPAKKIRNGKNGFQSMMIKDDYWEEQIEFNFGIRLSQAQYHSLLPYCNALDFESYRDREMSMDDEGYIGYRDEINVTFAAITDSYIPYLELPMHYYYDENHIWLSEKLYRYIYKAFLSNNKQLRKWTMGYGACSLFY